MYKSENNFIIYRFVRADRATERADRLDADLADTTVTLEHARAARASLQRQNDDLVQDLSNAEQRHYRDLDDIVRAVTAILQVARALDIEFTPSTNHEPLAFTCQIKDWKFTFTPAASRLTTERNDQREDYRLESTGSIQHQDLMALIGYWQIDNGDHETLRKLPRRIQQHLARGNNSGHGVQLASLEEVLSRSSAADVTALLTMLSERNHHEY